MSRDAIKSGQLGALTAVFILGNTELLQSGRQTGRDGWISLLIALSAGLVLMLICGRIAFVFRGQNLFDILFSCFGKLFGGLIALALFGYCLLLCVVTVRSVTEFLGVTLAKTPQLMVAVSFVSVCAYAAWGGAGVVGRCGAVTAVFAGLVILSTSLLLIGQMKPANLRPVGAEGLYPVASDALRVFCFPLGESVLMLTLTGNLKREKSRRPILIWGMAAGGMLLLIGILRDILTLGDATLRQLIYPSFLSASVINIGGFLQHTEVIISGGLIACVFIKMAVCLHAAAQGGAKIFKVNYRVALIPISLVLIIIPGFAFKDMSALSGFVSWGYIGVSLPFCALLPVALWVAAEIRQKRGRFEREREEVSLVE